MKCTSYWNQNNQNQYSQKLTFKWAFIFYVLKYTRRQLINEKIIIKKSAI